MDAQSYPNYTLTGRITKRQGKLLEGLIVRAYDLDFDIPGSPLGEDNDTDAEGRYEVGFRGKGIEFSGVECGGPVVFIWANGGDGFNIPTFTYARNSMSVRVGDET